MSEIIPLPAGGTIRIMTDRVPPPITEITPLPANGTIRIAWIPEPNSRRKSWVNHRIIGGSLHRHATR